MRPSLVILTGAGISADSGLATFRSSGGLWEGMRVEDVASPETWARDPDTVWRFYQMRRALLGSVEPNAAHASLTALEAQLASIDVGFQLVTQNVDDLHERPGSTPIHMHGELTMLRCERCDFRTRNIQFLAPDACLPCESCGFERLRPDAVWFGEMPFHMETIERTLIGCTHFVAIGTSGNVYPAAGFLAAARAAGARTFVNSLDPPENLHPNDTFLAGRALTVVPILAGDLLKDLRA